ncbi:MarR family winged helix-turn-helix transcriptional regulator [Pseudarthrobacter sulfonivorans]|uniref:MarR family winged helix-turn-helix transcriptional regulator n=1 Tax=Pseudarthrobacter sulfonivorans TaxID=121292 RepID=UPI002102643F|nr:MarR family winged helix-turn-helix transcriptional regulator [Pseudarthrobacter sulfonivorans]
MTKNTNWLDERETGVWRGFLEASQQLVAAMDRQLVQESQLSGAEFAVLVPLSEQADGVVRARDLARSLGWDRSRLSHLLKRMEARGLLKRKHCSSDARGLDVEITRDGRNAIELAAPGHVDFVRTRFFDHLTRDEQDALASVSGKIIAALQPECG